MRSPEKKKAFRRMVADQLKRGLIPDGRGGWIQGSLTVTIHLMCRLGATHNR